MGETGGGGYLQERRDHNKEGGKESKSQGDLSYRREQSQKRGSLSGRGRISTKSWVTNSFIT